LEPLSRCIFILLLRHIYYSAIIEYNGNQERWESTLYNNDSKEPEKKAAEPENADLQPPCWDPCNEKISVKEQVTLSTKIEVEDIKAFCVGEPVIKPYLPFPPYIPTCKLLICQDICVKIPIKFSASLAADKRDVKCDKPCPGADSILPSPCSD